MAKKKQTSETLIIPLEIDREEMIDIIAQGILEGLSESDMYCIIQESHDLDPDDDEDEIMDILDSMSDGEWLEIIVESHDLEDKTDEELITMFKQGTNS